MSPLPRLAAPRGPSARIAAMVARAPAAQGQLELPLSPPSRLDAIAAAAGPRAHVWASPDAPPVVTLPPPCHDCGGPCAPERSRCEECLRTAAAKTAARRGGPRPRARRAVEVAPVPVKTKAPRAPKAPKAKGRKPAPPRLVWEGPVLLQERASGTGTAEQRERGCPRMGQCEDDWILAGREGQARCPAGCGVWRAVGGEEGE